MTQFLSAVSGAESPAVLCEHRRCSYTSVLSKSQKNKPTVTLVPGSLHSCSLPLADSTRKQDLDGREGPLWACL